MAIMHYSRAVATVHRLSKRDGERTLSGGAIAGIVIGIVVVVAMLLALLIWRLYTYKTNRDFFSGRPNALYPSQLRHRGHVRSTRMQRDSVLDMDVHYDDDNDEKRLVQGGGKQPEYAHHAHSQVDLGTVEGDQERAAQPTDGYPSETNRASWWWPYGGGSKAGNNNVQPSVPSEVMQPHHVASSTVANVEDPYAHEEEYRAEQPHDAAFPPSAAPATTAKQRQSWREGCSTQ